MSEKCWLVSVADSGGTVETPLAGDPWCPAVSFQESSAGVQNVRACMACGLRFPA